MKTQAQYIQRIPEYALSYLINGDNSGLTPDDIKTIDKYMSQFYQEAATYKDGNVVIDLMNSENAESYFTWSPAFGLACNVYDCNIIILSS